MSPVDTILCDRETEPAVPDGEEWTEASDADRRQALRAALRQRDALADEVALTTAQVRLVLSWCDMADKVGDGWLRTGTVRLVIASATPGAPGPALGAPTTQPGEDVPARLCQDSEQRPTLPPCGGCWQPIDPTQQHNIVVQQTERHDEHGAIHVDGARVVTARHLGCA